MKSTQRINSVVKFHRNKNRWLNFLKRNNLTANKKLVSSLIFCKQFVYVFQIPKKLLRFILLFGFILREINISVLVQMSKLEIFFTKSKTGCVVVLTEVKQLFMREFIFIKERTCHHDSVKIFWQITF